MVIRFSRKITMFNSEIRKAADKVVGSVIRVNSIKKIVSEYQAEILKKHRFKIHEMWNELGCSGIIEKVEDYYLMCDSDFQCYQRSSEIEAEKRGLNVGEYGCPYLTAFYELWSKEKALCLLVSAVKGWEDLKAVVENHPTGRIPSDVVRKVLHAVKQQSF